MTTNGKVYLVGAGPGDPNLLTVKALKLLQCADAVVCDRLVSDEILGAINPAAVFHDVGKISGQAHHQQQAINQLLHVLAARHQTVVRLKGGDPFIFGRGGEECLYLAEHGIHAEIVPGITAAVGCAAVAGIPLTHRGMASSVRFITGHFQADHQLVLDWSSMADPSCTLVFYMAVSTAPHIVEELIRHGRDPLTPAALIHAGTQPTQRLAVLALQDVPVRIAEFQAPTLLVIGDVVSLQAPLSAGLAQAPDAPASCQPADVPLVCLS